MGPLNRQEFYQYLPKFIGEVSKWANEIQEQDLARDVLASVIKQLEEINNQLPLSRRNKEKLLLLNNRLQNIDREISPHRKTLKNLSSKGYDDAEDLLSSSLSFVRTALTETQTTAKILEKEITSSLTKRNIKLSKEDLKRLADKPQSLNELLESYGLVKDSDIKRFLEFLDDNILKQYLSEDDYSEALDTLGGYLEE